jgi:hypothetical protein
VDCSTYCPELATPEYARISLAFNTSMKCIGFKIASPAWYIVQLQLLGNKHSMEYRAPVKSKWKRASMS